MANETDIQTTTTGVLLTPFSDKSTILEIIEGIESLKEGNLGINTNPELESEIKKLLVFYNKKINISEEKDILDFLKNLPIKEVSVEEIIGEGPKILETKLSQSEINELVDLQKESENASAEKRERIQKRLEEFMKKAPSESEKYIRQIRENLKSNPPTTPPLTHPGGQANRGEKVDIVEDFVEKVGGLDEDKKATIRLIINKTINGEPIPKGTENRKIEIVVKDFVTTKREELKQRKLDEIRKKFDIVIENSADENKKPLEEYRDAIIELHSKRTPDISQYQKEVNTMMEVNGVNPGTIERSSHDTQTILQVMYTTPKDLVNIIGRVKNLKDKSLLPNLAEVRSLEGVRKVFDNPEMFGLQKIVHSKIKIIESLSKLPGMSGLSETVGGVAMKEFMAGAMKVMAEKGMLTGAKAILQGIIAGSAATAEASGASAAAVTIAGLFSALPPVAIVIIAMMITVEVVKFAYKIYDTLAGWIHSATGVNFLWGARDFIAGIFGGGKFGKFVGTIGQVGVNAMVGAGVFVAALFGPILAAGLAAMTVLIPIVVTSFAVGAFLWMILFDMPKISSLVPPPPQGAGGTCWAKDDSGTPPPSSGEINCNQNAPEVNAKMSKEDFGKKADLWTSGTNYADECYHDAVNRSLCAGIDPNYTLAIWLHESGASNYSIPGKLDIEDFGIHGRTDVPKRNFDKQINYFLTLDMGPHCPDLPYWLSVSTNFLTGGCDPDLQNDIYPITGRMYYEDLKATYKIITGGDLPASIHVPKGGQNCGNNGGSKPVATNDHEFVNSDGILMVCSGPVDSEGNFIGIPGESKYDPNTPGLEGEVVPGECSVSASVKSTKQCGEAWSNKGLPGGSGTICSAGCGPSSVSSILRPINGSFTPDTVIFEGGSPYSNMGNEGSSLSDANTSLKKHGFTTAGVQGCSQEDIANWICQGQAVIILADSYTGSSGGTIGHILVADTVSNGKIITKDPYYSNSTPFVTSGGIVAGQIKNLRQCLPVFIK